jgi:hypothetical protein
VIPYTWLISGLIAVAALSGAYVKGRSDGKAVIVASQAREDQIRLETLQLAQLAAAEEIAKISVTHTTIRQKAEVITREVPVYTECRNDPVVSGLLDAARENRPPAESAGGGELPGAGAGPARQFW